MSTLRYSNIEYISTQGAQTSDLSGRQLLPPPTDFQPKIEWLERQVRKFYSDAEVDRVLTNRRSAKNDAAVIEDYFSFDQPEHPIPRDGDFEKALFQVREWFRPHRTLMPVAYPDLRYYPMTLNTNVGAPWNLETFKVKPHLVRNIDEESETPKLKEKLDLLWNLNLENNMDVERYLRIKQSLNLIDDAHRSKHNLYNEVFTFNRLLIHKIKDGDEPFWYDNKPNPYFWNTLFARSHVVSQDEEDKIRAVFGAPWLLLQAELMFIWPLQHCYQNFEHLGKLFWGREIMRGGWKKILSEIHMTGMPNTVLSLDWSQFDKRLLHELMDEVHKIWYSYMDFRQYEPTYFYPWGHNQTDPVRIERLWTWMCNAIKHTPTLLPDGRLYKWKYSGFGSGYQQTQLQDTFSNAIMIATCLSALGVDISAERFWIMLQGDDSMVTFFERMFQLYGNNFLHMIAEAALHYFNAKVNVKIGKSKISDKIEGHSALGYECRLGLPFRTDEDLLRHLMFPEKIPQSYQKLMASSLGLLLASCGCSRRFYDLCIHIFRKLEAKGFSPNVNDLDWLLKTGFVTDLSEVISQPIPKFDELLSRNYEPHVRTNKECQRVWPTEPGPHGRFYFLLV